MTILKTYAREFVENIEEALPWFENLHGRKADLRFRFEGFELAAIGDVLLIAGDSENYRHGLGPLIVDDVDATVSELVEHGAEIVSRFVAQTGRGYYVRHGGVTVEYLQWNDEVLNQVLGRRSGT
ncbi:hypothetical protein [Prauserella cavernicola]|uniref:Glyoxalase n=1 Tax=Prauserella cavernicola TaxID=2800127 RepID=A0A934QY60_9PSEU|nr:hypothetical protein [Prauserella cavernicola]MBK1787439.1 hypothetical protein [Prauserella cavernicola]